MADSSGQQLHLSNKNTNSCSVTYAAEDLKVVLLDLPGLGRVQDATLQCGSLCALPHLHCVCATLNCSQLCGYVLDYRCLKKELGARVAAQY